MNEQDNPIREISDDELVSLVNDEVAAALHSPSNEGWTSNAINYYNGTHPVRTKCSDPNVSTIVSMDLHDAVEATVAEIMPAFGGGHVATFEAESEQDEEQVKVESDICNYLFMEQYNGLDIMVTGLKAAQLHRNCYARVYWDLRSQVCYESYESVPETAIPQLMQPKAEEEQVDVIEHEEVDPPKEAVQQWQQAMQQYEQAMGQYRQQAMMMEQAAMMGQPVGQMPQPPQQPPPLPGFFDIRIRRTASKGKPVIESMPPEQSLVNSDHTEVDLTNARFSGFRSIMMKSELIQIGYDYDTVMNLSGYTESYSQSVRNRDTSGYNDAGKDATESVEVYICYIRADRDRDGIAELRRVVVCGNELLDDEPYDDTDIVAGTGCINPYSHEGISAYDVQKDVQDGKTSLLRSTIDAAKLGANPRYEIDDSAVNLDDFLTSITGGGVRTKRMGSIAGLPNPEVSQTTYSTLEMFDKLRRERGGGAIDSASQSMQIGGDSAHGIERVMSSIEQRNAMVARTFGETFIRGIFLRLHTLLRKFHQGAISAKINGKWTTSKPSEWPARERVSISVGNSQGERLRMASALQGVQMIQKEMLAQGMATTTPDKLYQSSVDQAEFLGIPHPEKYYIDPQSQEGQQLAQQNQQQAQQAQQKQEQLQQFDMQLKAKTTEAQVKVADAEMAKSQVAAQNNQLKHQVDTLKQQLAEAEAGADVVLEREKMDRDTAMKLLQLEQAAQKDLNAEYEDNKAEVA